MTMRRGLPHLVALMLGIGAALLAACGSSTRGGIPSADAASIKGQLEDVRTRVADGSWTRVDATLIEKDPTPAGLQVVSWVALTSGSAGGSPNRLM